MWIGVRAGGSWREVRMLLEFLDAEAQGGARQAEGLQPHSRRAPLAASQSP